MFARHFLKILRLLVNGWDDGAKCHSHTNLAKIRMSQPFSVKTL